jgi:uncharacterized protein (DUF2147 family)
MLKRAFLMLMLLAAMPFAPALAQNDANAVLGVWKNGEGTALIQVYKKTDSKYYGKLVWLKEPLNAAGKPKVDINNPDEALRTRPIKGLENLRGFVFKGDNLWEEGQIYDPKNGNDYSCKMELTDANTLEVRGFIGISLLGRTDVWKRQLKK